MENPDKKPRKVIRKEELIQGLLDSLTPDQWALIAKLTGREPGDSPRAKANFLNGLFYRSRNHSSRKSIGRNLQKWICREISRLTGLEYGKDSDIASREGGQAGADVRLSPMARQLFPFSVECKSGTWNIRQAIEQARANLYPDTDWLLCLDRPHAKPEFRIEPVIVISGEQFFKLMEKICQTNR